MVQMGGLGFIHYNLPVEEQVAQALRVKRHVPGFMVSPAALSAHSTVADWEGLKVQSAPSRAQHVLYRCRRWLAVSDWGLRQKHCVPGAEGVPVRVRHRRRAAGQPAAGHCHLARHRVCQRPSHAAGRAHDHVRRSSLLTAGVLSSGGTCSGLHIAYTDGVAWFAALPKHAAVT